MKANKSWLRWGMALAVVVSFILNFRAVYDRKPDINGDNIHYFLLAKALSEGKGFVNTFGPEVTPHMHFPPGYPAFMSVFMKVFPDNIAAMKILNAVLLICSLLLLFRILRKITGGNTLLAFLTCLACTFHPELLRWSTMMMSEMLYLFISLCIISLCIEIDMGKAFAGEKRQWGMLFLLALLVGSAYLVRTMGLSVILAAALSFFCIGAKYFIQRKQEGAEKGRWWKAWCAAAVVILALVVTWGAWNIRNQVVSPGHRSEYFNDFMRKDNGETMSGLADWTARLKSNTMTFTTYYIPHSLLDAAHVLHVHAPKKGSVKGWLVGLLVLGLMLWGLLSCRRGRVLLISYFVITFGVLLLYPEQFGGVRYFVTLIPLMIFALFAGIWQVFEQVGKLFPLKMRPAIPAVLLAAFALTFLLPAYHRDQKMYRDNAKVQSFLQLEAKNPIRQYVEAALWIKENGRGNVIVACRKPEMMYFYSGFHAINLPRYGTPDEVMDFLKKSKAQVVVIDTWFKHAYLTVYPAVRANASQFIPLFRTEKVDPPTFVLMYNPDGRAAIRRE